MKHYDRNIKITFFRDLENDTKRNIEIKTFGDAKLKL